VAKSVGENVSQGRKKSLEEMFLKPPTSAETLMNKCWGIGFVELAILYHTSGNISTTIGNHYWSGMLKIMSI
jgi:hypothetical protein